MNTLTLNGRAQNNVNGFTINFDPASTWTIGDGTTSTINLNSQRHSFDTHSIFFKLPSLVLNAGTTTITGNGNNAGFHFTGSISGGGGLRHCKERHQQDRLSGNNTYTGTTEINGGILRLSHANALPGGIGATGGTSALTLNGGVIELAAGDFSAISARAAINSRSPAAPAASAPKAGHRVVNVNGDATLELVWGSASFNPTTLELNSPRGGNTDTTDSDLTISNKIDLNGATAQHSGGQ
jgi:hypothetical protein